MVVSWFAVLAGFFLIIYAVAQLPAALRHHHHAGGQRGQLVEELSDPREAAAVLMVFAALRDGHVSLAAKQQVSAEMVGLFSEDDEAVEGLFSFGRMAVGQIGDVPGSVRRLLVPLKDQCTPEELGNFVDALERMVEISPPPADLAQRGIIAKIRAEI